MSQGQAIAKNAAWLMMATVAQKAVAFVIFTLIARWMGVDITGRYFFAVSVTSVFVTFTDLGMTPVVIREMAADLERGKQVLARALVGKAILIPLTGIATLSYAWLTQSDPSVRVAIALACLVMSADAVSLLWYGTLRGMRKLRYEAIGMFVGQLVTGIGCLLVARVFHAGVNGLVIALFAGSAWNVIWSLWRSYALGIRVALCEAWSWKMLARQAWPFALAGIFVKIYSYVDTLMLNQFHGTTAVGYYAVAYKVTYAFQFLPLTFVAALYPGMSAAFAANDRDGLKRILHGSMRLMMVMSVPIAAGLSAFAPRLIPVVYGNVYRVSGDVLAILSWVLIPIFLDFPIGSLLNATHRAALKTTAMGVTMVINVIANGVFVPRLGPIGAAWSGLISFWVLFVLGVWFARKDIADRGWAISLFARGILCAGVFWTFIRFGLVNFGLLPAIICAVVFGSILLVIARLVVAEDARMLTQWIKRKQPIVTL